MSDFKTFWASYPRKIEKRAAEKAWNRAVKKYGPESIMLALELMKREEWEGRKLNYIPYAASWINATDFDDEFEARADDREALPLFTMVETDSHLTDRAELIHRSLTREQEVWRREAAVHRCNCGEWCKYRKEPRVPTMDELLQHLKGGR